MLQPADVTVGDTAVYVGIERLQRLMTLAVVARGKPPSPVLVPSWRPDRQR